MKMSSYTFFAVIGLACLFQVNGQTYEAYGLQPAAYQEAYATAEQPHVRARRQLFGGFNSFPTGGNFQEVGYQAGPLWGSMSKTTDNFGFTSPNKYSGGFDFHTDSGLTGLSGKFDSLSGFGTTGSVLGKVGILNEPDHKAFGWAKHENTFDSGFGRVGPETNSAGLSYFNVDNSAEAFAKISHTPGMNDLSSLGAKIPFADGNAAISGKFDTKSGVGSLASIRGDAVLADTEKFKLTGFAQHNNAFDENFDRIKGLGLETNSAGLSVLHKDSGATAFAKGSHTPAQHHDKGSVGVNVPISLTDDGKVKLEVGAQTNFGQGMKPEHQVGGTLKIDLD